MKSKNKDTKRLTWLLKYITEHGTEGLHKLVWTVKPNEYEDDLDLRFDRKTIDRAMKLAKTEKADRKIELDEYSSSAGYGGWGHDE